MTKLFTYIGEFMIKNIDKPINAYSKDINSGWVGAKKNNKGLYDIYYYKTFPKKSYNKHRYLRNLNEN